MLYQITHTNRDGVETVLYKFDRESAHGVYDTLITLDFQGSAPGSATIECFAGPEDFTRNWFNSLFNTFIANFGPTGMVFRDATMDETIMLRKELNIPSLMIGAVVDYHAPFREDQIEVWYLVRTEQHSSYMWVPSDEAIRLMEDSPLWAALVTPDHNLGEHNALMQVLTRSEWILAVRYALGIDGPLPASTHN